MKKLEAILKGCEFLDKLFGYREKEIRRKLEAAKDQCETCKIQAQIEYEESMNKLGGKDVDYEAVINDMIKAKEKMLNADMTLKAIKEIEGDLNSEVKVEPETKKA